MVSKLFKCFWANLHPWPQVTLMAVVVVVMTTLCPVRARALELVVALGSPLPADECPPGSVISVVYERSRARAGGDGDLVVLFCKHGIITYELSSHSVLDVSSNRAVETEYEAVARVGDGTIYLFGNLNSLLTEVWTISRSHSDLSWSWTQVNSYSDEFLYGSALWDGEDFIYLLAASGISTQIRKYSISTNTVSEAGALDAPLYSAAGAWLRQAQGDRSYAHLFGGSIGSIRSDGILQYDPETESVTTLSARLPLVTSNLAAASTGNGSGSEIYLLCGGPAPPPEDTNHNFMRYVPVSGELTTEEVYGFDFECSRPATIYSVLLNRVYMFGNRAFEPEQMVRYIELGPRPAGCSARDKYGTLHEALLGHNATKRCPSGSVGTSTWFCTPDGEFDGPNPNYIGCASQWLEDLQEVIENGTPLDSGTTFNIFRGIRKNLIEATNPESNTTYFGHELKFLFGTGPAILELVKNSTQMSTMEELTETAFGIFHQLLLYWSPWGELSQRDRSDVGTVFMQSSDRAARGLGHRFRNNSTSSYRKSYSFDQFQVLSGAENVSSAAAIADRITFPPNYNQKSDSYLEIPVDWAQYFPGQDYVVFSGFSLTNANASTLFPAQLSPHAEAIVNGPMMGFTFSKAGTTRRVRRVDFTGGEGVRIIFQHQIPAWGPARTQIRRRLHAGETSKAVSGSGVCVYWNEEVLSWSPDGCRLVSSDSHTTICECFHLTAFAVLFDMHDYIGKNKTLEMITWILCLLSIFCLVVTIVVLAYSRYSRKPLLAKHPRNDLTLYLCISLLLANLLIMITMDKDYLELSDGVCVASAILLHYSLVVAFAWMALEGILLAKLIFIDVFATGREYATFEGCGALVVPGIIVGATFAVNHGRGEHAYGNDAFCWLHGRYLWSFISLVAAVLVFNTSVLVMSIRKSYMHHSNPNRAVVRKAKSAGFWIRGALSLTFIMGLTWVSGFLMLIDDPITSNVAAYIFTAANASQGIFIFVFHIGSNKQVRRHFKTITFVGTNDYKENRNARTPRAGSLRVEPKSAGPSHDSNHIVLNSKS